MDRYLGGEEIDADVLVARPGDGGRPRVLLSGARHVRRDRHRAGGTAGGTDPGLPVAGRAGAASGHPTSPAPRPGRWLRSRRAAARRGGAHHDRPVPGPGLPGPASFPAPCARTRPCMWPATVWQTGATRTTTATSASATCIRRWGPAYGRCRTAWPATSARSPNWAPPRPGTPYRPGNAAADPAVGHAGSAVACCDRGRPHGDEDALAKSLGKVAAGDPALRVERNAETHQLILWCMGEAHARRGPGQAARAGRETADRRRGHAAAGDVRRAGGGPRPARQTVRRPRPIRCLRHRGGAAGARRRVSNSSTRPWAGSFRGPSSPRWRRACGPRCRRAYPPASRWWTSG